MARKIEFELPEKFGRIIESTKRFLVLIGGRGSAKSESVARFLIMKMLAEPMYVLCGREFQSSIDDSVHKLLKEIINDNDLNGLGGFNVLEKRIDRLDDRGNVVGGFRFKGLARNPSAVKSAQGFWGCWIEEAQTLSKESLQDLIPTIRAAGSQLFFTANPKSSADPFSQRFIVKHQKKFINNGYAEDDDHLIVFMNYMDNPWFPPELERDRLWDLKNSPHAIYEHIWMGAFNDSIEDAIIPAEDFDDSIDLHVKFGLEPKGIKVVAHDPSDKGPDNKGLCYRHGSVILGVWEKAGLDVNEGCDWALDYAIDVQADYFVCDADGLGASLRRQAKTALVGKKMDYVEFRGSFKPNDPNKVYQHIEGDSNRKAKTNKQTFRNLKSQQFWRLRDRFHNAHLAMEKFRLGQPFSIDPDELISLSSDIENMAALRAEVCRIPTKPNGQGLIQIMSKPEMARLGIASPNMADALMMSLYTPKPKLDWELNQRSHQWE